MIEVPMTEAQFTAAKSRLQQNGIEVSGDEGTLTRQGITATYQYTEGVLRITIVKKPMLVPESMIEGQMRTYIHQALA